MVYEKDLTPFVSEDAPEEGASETPETPKEGEEGEKKDEETSE